MLQNLLNLFKLVDPKPLTLFCFLMAVEITIKALAAILLSLCLLLYPGVPRVVCYHVEPLLLGTVITNLFDGSHPLICWPCHTSNFLIVYYILKE
jgi:hypothetical protein